MTGQAPGWGWVGHWEDQAVIRLEFSALLLLLQRGERGCNEGNNEHVCLRKPHAVSEADIQEGDTGVFKQSPIYVSGSSPN